MINGVNRYNYTSVKILRPRNPLTSAVRSSQAWWGGIGTDRSFKLCSALQCGVFLATLGVLFCLSWGLPLQVGFVDTLHPLLLTPSSSSWVFDWKSLCWHPHIPVRIVQSFLSVILSRTFKRSFLLALIDRLFSVLCRITNISANTVYIRDLRSLFVFT